MAKNKDTEGLNENKIVAKKVDAVTGDARKGLELKSDKKGLNK